MAVANSQLHDAVEALDLAEESAVAKLVGTLDETSKLLAASGSFRADMGRAEPDVWRTLRQLWTTIAAAHIDQLVAGGDDGQEAILCTVSISLARFTRNLVAATPYNQERAFENEADIHEVTRYYTSYAALQNPKSLPVARMLAQTLCNLITANEDLMQRLWDAYLGGPEDRLILTRLLSVPDAATSMAAFVLILNCLHGSQYRLNRLIQSPNGQRLLVSLLDRMASLFDEDPSDGSRAFDVGYSMLSKIIEAGAVPAAYARIAVKDEIVSPHQTTLLKILDSYLQSSQGRLLELDSGELRDLSHFLSSLFFALATYCQASIKRALGSTDARTRPSDGPQSSGGGGPAGDAASLQELDLLLPKVCEALVLVTQCLTSLCLNSEESANTHHPTPTQQSPSDDGHADGHLKDELSSAVSPSGEGIVESLIETLRQLDLFLPRIAMGKVAPAAVPVQRVPETARELHQQAQVQDEAGHARTSDPKGFSYLKRDLVRLLGILSSERKTVQDRTRACGGIQVVMNLCVIDERNPYLREHAIFALRNLLHGNNENQKLVNEIQPVSEWDDDGVLQRR